MSQILLRRLSAHSLGVRAHGCRRLSSVVYGGGGERRRPSAQPPQDEESRAVRVSVWWDFENCGIPNGINVCRVAPRVAAALRAAGIRGPVSITAFGDVVQLARSSQEALAATGVSISHVPHGGKNSSDRSFMADLVYWIAQNPPPVHFFLISGDKDFANLLHRLRMSNYNILLACPSKATSILCSAATFMWHWEALVKGEDFSPKHFNHPPDGLHGSWYGYYKGALDDPFLEKESREPIPNKEKESREPIPNKVTKAIVETLRLNPKGMTLSLLREELRRNNVSMGTEFFGHKKFSSLLQSMPDIVEVIDPPSGGSELYAILANNRLLQSGDGSSKTLSSAQCNVRENNFTQAARNDKKHPSLMSTPEGKPLSSSQRVDRSRSLTETVSEKRPTFAVPSSPLVVLSEDQKEYQTANKSAQIESPSKHMEVDEKTIPETPSSSGLENAVNKDGLLKKIWVLWNGPENAESEVSQNCESTSTELVDDLRIPLQEHSADHCVKFLRGIHKTSSKNNHADCSDSTAAVSDKLPISSDDDDSENIKRDPSLLENLEPCSRSVSVSRGKAGEKDSSKKIKGLFSWASRWWTSGKSGADNSTTNRNVVDETTDSIEAFESSNASACGRGQQVVNEIFAKAHLWDVLEQQLSKPLGSEVVSKAKTREELACGLQKLGCWPLKGLSEKDLHHLVHLLISEKKWIEETSSRPFPFRLTLPHKRTYVLSNSSKSGVLSSIFVNGKPHKGKYSDDNSRRNKHLTREEILSDCHKLLTELLSQHKYGFNISIFKRRFSQKHGYELDHQKLGYPDLASLLQIMPDARIKFPRVLPVQNENGQAGSKETGNENNGDDLIWEELGPVSATTGTSAAEVDKEMCYRPPTPSDDEFSDNDSQAEQQPRRNAEHSSLLQIIDSWNSSKDDGSSKKPQDIDGLVDSSKSNLGSLDNLTAGDLQRHTRLSQRQYSFVSDSEEDKEKDKLVESVLGSLQKARGTKLRN